MSLVPQSLHLISKRLVLDDSNEAVFTLALIEPLVQ